ncbi:MAG TPA: tetratricopeptide repeat protein [Bacteroidia bacterium]|nr:tetratricopeptide repeat protein [Bacteroidia bacterium]
MANKKAAPSSKLSAGKATPKGPFHFKGRRFNLVFTLIVIAGCFILYGNSAYNGYSLDDEFVLHGDSTVQKGVKGIPTLFKSRYAWDQKGAYGYRPVAKVTFAIEDQFFGLAPGAGHVINVIIYACIVIFLFYFLRRILYGLVSDYFLFIVIALFLTHPLHTEVVDSLKNRDAMLSFFFGLLCSYSFVRSFETQQTGKRIAWIVLGCIAIDMGALAKLDTLLFGAITPLVLYFFTTKNLKSCGLAVLYMLIGGIIGTMLKKMVLPHSDYHRTFLFFEDPLIGTHWYQRIQLGFASLWFYVSKFVFPKDLVSYYGYDAFHAFPKWTDISVICGIITAGIIAWYTYINRKERGIWLFSLLLFTGTMAAFINVVKVGPGIVAERFMFIPSIGFVLIASLLLFKVFKVSLKDELSLKSSGNLFACAAIIVCVYSVRVIIRNPDWKTHLTIYEHDAKLAPRSAKLQSLLAAAYIDEIKKNKTLSSDQIGNYYQLAEKAFLAAIDVYPGYYTSLNNLGMIEYLYYKDMNAALGYFSKALAIDSTYTEAWFNSGSAYRELKNYPMAEKCFLRTIEVNPKYDMAYIYLSKLYESEGKYDEVLKLNENAVKNGHATDAVYVSIGKVYLIMGDTVTAISNFDKALQYFSKNEKLCEWLAHYYFTKKDTAKAQYYIRMRENAVKYGEEAVKRQ